MNLYRLKLKRVYKDRASEAFSRYFVHGIAAGLILSGAVGVPPLVLGIALGVSSAFALIVSIGYSIQAETV